LFVFSILKGKTTPFKIAAKLLIASRKRQGRPLANKSNASPHFVFGQLFAPGKNQTFTLDKNPR
jgi:hypothetical protein